MGKKGFTLIELLIVIAIVAILAGAMVPMFRVTRLEAQQAKVAADMDTIKTASIMLHHDTGAWTPGSVAGVTNGDGLINDNDGAGGSIPGWNGPYLDEWKDNPWAFPYQVYDSGVVAPIRRRVRSLGADNAIGGTGANEDAELIITPDTAI